MKSLSNGERLLELLEYFLADWVPINKTRSYIKDTEVRWIIDSATGNTRQKTNVPRIAVETSIFDPPWLPGRPFILMLGAYGQNFVL